MTNADRSFAAIARALDRETAFTAVSRGLHAEPTWLDEVGGDLDAFLAPLRQSGRPVLLRARLTPDFHRDDAGDSISQRLLSADAWRETIERAFGAAMLISHVDDNAVAIVAAFGLSAAHIRRLAMRRRLEKRRRKLLALIDRPRRALALKRRRLSTLDDLAAALAGRSIAIVGNARGLASAAEGAAIDAHDIVLRFNAAPIASARSHGRRTDWLATSMPIERELAEERQVERILWLTQKRDSLPLWLARGPALPLFLADAALYAAIQQATGLARPSTGAMAIALIDRLGSARTVTLYGFDFFASLSLSGTQTAATTPHDFAGEARYVLGLIEKRPDWRWLRIGASEAATAAV
jgi:hypothetical protein